MRTLRKWNLETGYSLSDKPRAFRRKVNQLDAMRVTADNVSAVAKWCGGEVQKEDDPGGYIPRDIVHPTAVLLIPSLSTPLQAFNGDWVARDEDGRFHVFNHKAFREEYDPIGTRRDTEV